MRLGGAQPKVGPDFLERRVCACYEGYGPTEAAPVITSNHRENGEHHIGTVGTVISGGEIRLAPDGEILYRGPNVMLGYYHRPDLTAEALDEEGFSAHRRRG